MKFGSVCSGVEAASLAWMPLGWECKFVSEIEPFPCAVLQHRFGASAPINQLDPNEIIITDEEWALIDELKKANKDWMKVCDNADLISRFKERKQREAWIKGNALLNKEGKIPNEGDFTKIGKKYAGQIDLLVGGTPCQDLSIAGKRAGFDGERSSLALDFVRLAYESQCKWFVWENVPGVFSSNQGRDFATLLSLFTGSKVEVPQNGWGTAGFVCNARRDRFGVSWKTLDGQFTRTQRFPFAVPQRRRRVFVVGYFGDWTRAADVLLEPARVCWDNPPRFRAREKVAEIVGTDPALARGALRGVGTSGTKYVCSIGNGQFNGLINDPELAQTLNCMHDQQAVLCTLPSGGGSAQTLKIRSGKEGGGKGALVQNELSATLGCGNDQTLFVTRCYENHANDSRITESSDVSPLISSRAGTEGGNLPLVQETIAFEPGIAKREGGDSRFTENFCGTLRGNAGDNQHAVAIAENIIGRKVENGGNGVGAQDELAYTQNATGVMGVCTSTVRRLLPIECERLMGFPDNWTRIPWKGLPEEDCPDSPRYKACGNSMCVNVMQWIGEQIERVEKRK